MGRWTKADDEAMELVRKLNDFIASDTGAKVYEYTSKPTETSTRIVFFDRVCLSGAEALAHIQVIAARIKDGTWDRWCCRRECPWSFTTRAERDVHEAGCTRARRSS